MSSFLSWASQVLDSVDEQATVKVAEVHQQIQQGAPVSSLFGIHQPAGGSIQSNSSTASTAAQKFDSPTKSSTSASTLSTAASSASSITASSSAPSTSLHADDATRESSNSNSATPIIAPNRSPARPIRTTSNTNLSQTTTSSGAPKHNKEPTAKSVATNRDDEYLALLNSSTPLVATPVRTPLKDTDRPRSSSPVLISAAPSTAASATVVAAAATPLSPPSSSVPAEPPSSVSIAPMPSTVVAPAVDASPQPLPQSLTRTASGSLLSSFLNRVSPNTSPALLPRKLIDKFIENVPTTTLPTSSLSGLAPSFSSTNRSASPLPPTPAATSTSAHSSSDLLEAQNEIASLTKVWQETRAQNTKLKGLLEQAKELYTNKLQEAADASRREMEAKEKEHQRQLEEVRKINTGSVAELGQHMASVVKLKLEHSRELSARDTTIRELRDTLETTKSKVDSLETALRLSEAKLDEQSAHHSQQLALMREESEMREMRAEETRQLHTERVESFHSRGEELESVAETHLTLLASLQRQLEASQRECDELKTQQRLAALKTQSEAQDVEYFRAKMSEMEKQHQVTIAGLKARMTALTTKNDELTAQMSEWTVLDDQYKQRIAQLESDLTSYASQERDIVPETPSRSLEDEQRLQTMAEHLLAKSQSLERATAEKTALKMQLENEGTKVNNLEIQLRAWKEKYTALENNMTHSGGSDDRDLETGAMQRRNGSSASSKSRSYGVEGAHITGLQPENAIAKAVGFIDSMGQQLTLLLRRYPPVRVGFGIYLVIIHLWCIVVFYHLVGEFGTESHQDDAPRLPPGMSSNLGT